MQSTEQALAPSAPGAVNSVRLAHLVIRDFRNIARSTLDVPFAGFVLVGQNGQGKTNLLEAIHYAHALRSMRGARDRDLVRFGQDAFHLSFSTAPRESSGPGYSDVRIGVERTTGRKRIVLDGVETSRQADALGALPSVVLSPRDVTLVEGAPAERRRFVDIVLATTSLRYVAALQRYRAALVRRNAALREVSTRGATNAVARVSIWESALSEHGAVLWHERSAWLALAAARLGELCSAMGEVEPVTMRLLTNLRDQSTAVIGETEARERLASLLAASRTTDLRRGLTQHGPHRDDLVFEIRGRPLKTFGSAGQQRTLSTALRLVERETLRDRIGRTPLLLLDDPFAELDRSRSSRILELLDHTAGDQTILAVPKPDDVPESYTRLARWHVEGGVIDAEG